MTTIRVGLYGAAGYTGQELAGLLLRHPGIDVAFATSETYAGRRLNEVAAGAPALPLVRAADAGLDGVDAAMLCLPHAAAAPRAAAALEAGARVVDLSADFRLKDAAVYERWYGEAHAHPELLDEAVYGLTEHARPALDGARLVANPGCYPTSILLPLGPLAAAGALTGTLVADSKSGVSGAGRAPKQHTSFVEVADNLTPYAVGRAHRHLPEIEQGLRAFAAGGSPALSAGDATPDAGAHAPPGLIFTPHLLPVPRGILSTIYAELAEGWDGARAREALEARYADEAFVSLLPEGATASLAHVLHTNRCAISLHEVAPDEGGGAYGRRLVIASAIDNLVKGAAGQALQNLNRLFGLEETLGLVA